jgi:small subunit ribosomal protein S4
MARYRGPKSKIARRFRDPIFGPDKALDRRAYGPGQHGPSKRRGGKQSEYAIQLAEKQKAKYTYGILERQFSNLFEKASSMKGITGENLLQLCETRLDNTVYRLGIAPTRSAARQFVTHKHITVNGEIVNIPSYTLKVGDLIGVREKSKSLEVITGSLTSNNKKYDWLDWDNSSMSGKLLSVPSREMIPENIKEQLIVELYSK